MRVRTLVCALPVLVGAMPARAQSPAPGWTLVVRIVPNPLPPGRCASISTEVQDDQGYRATALSNGAVIDFHKFRYSADTTSFQWRNGDPIAGYLCTRPEMAPAHTTVTVTLPDGLSASVELSSLAPGQVATPVRYPPQAPLKIAGVPPPKRAQVTSGRPSGSTSAGPTIAATPDGAVASPPVGTEAIARRPVSRTSAGGLKPSGSTAAGSTTPDASGGASSGNTSGSTDPAGAGQPSGGGTSSAPPMPVGSQHITTATLVFAGSYSASGPRIVVLPTPLVFVVDGQGH